MLKSEEFYLLRTPYLPVSLAEKILNNPELNSEIIQNLCKNEDIKEAILLASPLLFETLGTYLVNKGDKLKLKKIEHSLFKYIIRATCRSTPFGMFSGVSLGSTGDSTKIVLNSRSEHTPIARLDMQLLEKIVHKVALLPDVQLKVKFYPNSSSYVINGSLNYFETYMIGKTKAFNLSRIDYNEHIKRIIEVAEEGATKEQFRSCFDLTTFDLDEVDHFVDELIENEILVHKLFPSLTCSDAFEDVIEKTKSLNLTSLASIENSLRYIKDITENPMPITQKRAIIGKEIQKAFDIWDYDGDFFQVDLKLNKIENQINKKVLKEITEQAEEISAIMPNTVVEDLNRFKAKYYDRYENQELPLTQVLDPEFGIGYGDQEKHTVGDSVLIGAITNFNNDSDLLLRLDSFQNLKSQKLYDALRDGLYEVSITEEDVRQVRLSKSVPTILPDSMYIMGTLLAQNCEEVDTGSYMFKLDYFNGPSALTLLARFCHTDNELTQKLRCVAEKEEALKDAIYAEIVHSSQSRLGNVVHRPVLRDFEIPFLSIGGTEKEKCIDINDLLVSVFNGELILRSKRLNKRVIPCLSSAQNFRFASLPLYKFLCDLQHQGIMASFVWTWDGFRTAKFLPRVTYKKLIIYPATWNIDQNALKYYTELNQSSDLSMALMALRKDYKVPDKVLLIDGDNKLLIDLDNPHSLKIVFKHHKANGFVTFSESFLSTENCLVKDIDNQSYTNEIVIPVTNHTGLEPTKAQHKNLNSLTPVQRKFIPGSEWLYIKIYGGTILLDALLKTKIISLIKVLEEKRTIDKWFFIRYNDPEAHIRLRFHLTDQHHFGWVVKQVNECFHFELINKTIYKIQYDEYERELERYGNDLIEICETIFWKDSVSIIEMLDHCSNTEYDENLKWLFGLQSVDEYLSLFKINLEDRINFTEILSETFMSEFGDSKVLKHDLNSLYNINRSLIEKYFINDYKHYGFLELCENRSKSLKNAASDIINHYILHDKVGINIPILPSLIHMNINRLFPIYQRKYEMIIYFFLNRYYKKVFYSNKRKNS
ncbi:lantibiotic dehydratase [Elizabethkingia anophelis]|uniref:lantibiotic dehydratase n=1 Tax=Elizabethkingia anophelis TaxID=1117645 RepID=UPI000C9AEA8C|nr:lantibiotic dehydratase [Elizabethkingia anophelis]MCT3759642.1 lantibiotic dehydratase [Elizabethkingia anophelis]MCT3974447.1 lantibiotic dehydratase [Elizabethkingia anophelis]MCT4002848.1 lantibiotic dehydratase [Elizabethkingia anophelis]MCT4016868.1 lantibiotic dehydratase [Elizabethkingia anophelis]MCT4020539.1 lantibiotic dehydratase [Elizabethkingia anophelis]